MTKVIYKGGGFIQGIPARDLTLAEWEALNPDQQKQVIESGLYELIEVSPKKVKKEEQHD